MSPQQYSDPVDAYDRLAPHYAHLCLRRRAYLETVERLISERLPPGSHALLDLGSGDGKRAFSIARRTGIQRLVVLEPAPKMTAQGTAQGELWPIRAEDLTPDKVSERFDVITCLWNVLGHITSPEKRRKALCHVADLLSPEGIFFLDVIHRYNLRSYGILPTCGRWIGDQIAWSESNGDVRTKWLGGSISTFGHVFTHREVSRMAQSAGLQQLCRIVVDYETGKLRRFACMGNLFYAFRRSSRSDSRSAPQTS